MFATILLPNFYLQAIARQQPKLREQPLAVLDATAIKAVILQLNEAAEKEGVRAGMTPSQALARCDLVAQAGIAENADASFLAANRAEPVLEVREAKEFLAPLPIETLAVEAMT